MADENKEAKGFYVKNEAGFVTQVADEGQQKMLTAQKGVTAATEKEFKAFQEKYAAEAAAAQEAAPAAPAAPAADAKRIAELEAQNAEFAKQLAALAAKVK